MLAGVRQRARERVLRDDAARIAALASQLRPPQVAVDAPAPTRETDCFGR